MTASLPSGTIARAEQAGYREAEDQGKIPDPSYVGLTLPEPSDKGRSGIVFCIYPISGARPGGPSLIFPAEAIVRVSVPDMRVSIFDSDPGRTGERHSLGSLNDAPAMSPRDRRILLEKYTALLDEIAPALASGAAPDTVQLRQTRECFAQLLLPALLDSYRHIAPLFIRAMKIDHGNF